MTFWQRLYLRSGMRLRDAALTALVCLLALYLFVASPLADLGLIDRPILVTTFLLAIISGVLVVARSRGFAMLITAFGLSLIPVEVWRIVAPSPLSITIFNVHAALFLSLLMVTLITRVMGRGRVNWHRILGAVAAYLSFGIICTCLYTIIETNAPGAFAIPPGAPSATAGSHFSYFSFVTLTSTGYGDVQPVHPFARAVANFEAIVGQLFPAILIARLVSLAVRED